jgi:ribosome-associated protein
MAADLEIDGRVVIPGHDLTWSAARSSGPGGQNVNKVSTKVVLRFDLPGCTVLSASVKARLRALCKGRLDADGWLMITSQATRNRVRNLGDARERLADLIRHALVEPKPRKKRKPSRGAERRRVEQKRRHADKKRERSRSFD